MIFIFLNNKFYSDYSNDKYPQLELKSDRPYIHILLSYNGCEFALPLRSHIFHPHAFMTDKKNHCGVDYSKAVRITEDYIEKNKTPFIRPNEHKKLIGKDFRIQNGFEKYVQLYKAAKQDENFEHREEILKFSSLQYFEDYI